MKDGYCRKGLFIGLGIVFITANIFPGFINNNCNSSSIRKDCIEVWVRHSPSENSIINIASYEFDPRFGEPNLPENLRTDTFLPGEENYYLVQFMGPIKNEWKDQLRQLGGIIYDYIPHFSFIVKMNSTAKTKIENLSFIRWIGIYQPAYKLSSELLNITGLVNLTILVFKGEDIDVIAAAIEETGGNILYSGETYVNGIIKTQISASKIVEIANILGVLWVELWTQGSPDNYQASWVIQSNIPDLRSIFAHNLHGQNQIVTICDSGLDSDDNRSNFIHEAFDDPDKKFNFGLINPSHRKVLYYFFPVENNKALGDYDDKDGHGTHVSGTIAGDAPIYDVYDVNKYDGMQFGGKLIIIDIEKDWKWYVPSNYDNIYQPAYIHGSRIHSNSWGTKPHTDIYTNAARMCDCFMWKHKDFLILRSAGNYGIEGPGLLRPEAVAKNVVSCGATQNIVLDRPSYDPNNLAYFSSLGPCADGRIKPTVLAPGLSLISARKSTSDKYRLLYGTSMSTPVIAGAAALIRQYFMEGWHPSGIKNSSDSFTPSAALLKAMLVNGAVEITGQEAYKNEWNFYPNCNQGWGRIQLDNCLYFKGDSKRLGVVDNNIGLDTGEQIEYKIEVTDATEPFEVTLVWTDYPAMPYAEPALVNDLDLQVIDPDGNVYLGNVFSGQNPGHSTTGGTRDDRNVVECVLIIPPDIKVGNWTLKVVGTNIPIGKQPFALVTTGSGVITSNSYEPIQYELNRKYKMTNPLIYFLFKILLQSYK